MKDILKKSILFGLGVYSKTEKEARAMIKKLVSDKRLSRQEGERLVKEVFARSKKLESKVERQVKGAVAAMAQSLKKEAKKDLALLEKKLKQVSRRVLR